jgi:glycolate oxidase iron-sulfur subunit
MRSYGELVDGAGLPVSDVMAFLFDQGLGDVTLGDAGVDRVAYHDACHALRAQGIREQPRALLRRIPGVEVVDIPNGDRCCGAAGLYNVTEPELAGQLQRQKAEGVRETGATTIASANPGCTMQIRAGLAELGVSARVAHPVELLDVAIERGFAGA